jgi:metal-dependent amidase/aminoacylase/carboxypeptidase family protein
MAILAALARRLAERPPQRGRVALLFQPAEETGEGARRVLEDPRFTALRPDWVLALHTLPGVPLAEVLVREGAMACGSTGFVGMLRGRTAHAAHPEEGRSPAAALSRLIEQLGSLATREDCGGHRAMSTVVHARLGDVAFGTSPGEATIMATLRSDQDHVLSALQQAAEREVAEQANRESLSWQTSIADTFPVAVNHPDAVALVWEAAVGCGLRVSTPSEPLRWSEDFAWYGRVARSALVGFGAGVDHPPLHSPCFDFPDALLEPGVTLLEAIVCRLTGEAG